MPYLMIVLIPYINLLNLSWIIKCLFLRDMEPLMGHFLSFLGDQGSVVQSIVSLISLLMIYSLTFVAKVFSKIP